MSDIKKLKEAYLEVVSGKVNEGTLMREYERGEFRKGDEKRFVALIKKHGGKNIDVETPTGGDSMLNIQFKGGNIKRMQQELSKNDDGLTSIEEKVSEDIDPELLKKAAVGKKKSDDEEKDGKKAVPAGKDVDVEKDDESDGSEKEDKVIPPKKKKKDDDEEKEEPPVDEDNSNDKSDDGEGLDKVQPKAVKKKFADRKDKDIDNDGDVDDSDKFLHKRRKAVSKAMAKESFEESTAELIEALSNMFEKKNADTAAPEEIDSKDSPKAKEFTNAHKKSDKKIEDNYEDGVKKTTDAGKGGPSPKKRPGDNSNGDPAPKGVKEESDLIQKTLEQLRKI